MCVILLSESFFDVMRFRLERVGIYMHILYSPGGSTDNSTSMGTTGAWLGAYLPWNLV